MSSKRNQTIAIARFLMYKYGLYQQLEERGIEDGDTVSLDGYEFEYQR